MGVFAVALDGISSLAWSVNKQTMAMAFHGGKNPRHEAERTGTAKSGSAHKAGLIRAGMRNPDRRVLNWMR